MVQNRDPDPIEQLCLLSPDKLRRMQQLVPRQQKGEVAARKVPRRDSEERVGSKNDCVQDKLPGF